MTGKHRWIALFVAAGLAWPGMAAPTAGQLAAPPAQLPDDEAAFDPAHTRFGFELRTRWGQRVAGWFPIYDGGLVTLPDGRRQVHIRLMTGSVEVDGPQRYTTLARGEGFFDADRYPVIEFLSEPQPPELGHDGGVLRGKLTMHGVSRIESFVVAPATCSRPAYACDSVVTGRIERHRYGLDQWRAALGDTVRFHLRVRLQEPPR